MASELRPTAGHQVKMTAVPLGEAVACRTVVLLMIAPPGYAFPSNRQQRTATDMSQGTTDGQMSAFSWQRRLSKISV
jgi:hypothetical protein